jgi:hypothetical protein
MSVQSERRFRLQHVQQITDSHCGPAVVQMMLAHLGLSVSQEQVAAAAEVTDFIAMHGTRVDQLALAAHRLAPGTLFWVKDHAELEDIELAVNEHGHPVGVEWQGVFDDEDPEKNDPDYGHYSIVSHVSQATDTLHIVDPYKDYYEREREFPTAFFRRRWWDHNEVKDPVTGEIRDVIDVRLMFVIVPREEDFPRAIGMREEITPRASA